VSPLLGIPSVKNDLEVRCEAALEFPGLFYPCYLFDRLHGDIDKSYIYVEIRSGSARVTLWEQVIEGWENRLQEDLVAGSHLNKEVAVDSWWADGDHRLTVVAYDHRVTTEGRVVFESLDYS
jgi:hypothetical protein